MYFNRYWNQNCFPLVFVSPYINNWRIAKRLNYKDFSLIYSDPPYPFQVRNLSKFVHIYIYMLVIFNYLLVIGVRSLNWFHKTVFLICIVIVMLKPWNMRIIWHTHMHIYIYIYLYIYIYIYICNINMHMCM